MSPTLIENQVTYPIVTSFLGAPQVKTVRGFTMFGMSFVYVVFEDGTDIYWARSRVVEYLAKLQGRLPPGVAPQIGPDATSVGWVYQYALVDESGKHDLQELRALPGLVACATGSRASRASPRWRASAGSRSSTRSRSTRCA